MSDEMEYDMEDDHDRDFRDDICNHGHWLAYEIKRELPNSNPPDRLMRFMPLEQYLSLLSTRRLYIPRATEYEDPFDCAFPGFLGDAIRERLIKSFNEPEFSLPGDVDHSELVEEAAELLASELHDEFSEEVPDRWFVSCWHAGEAPTDLMWRSYGGHKGVCISCDGPALLQQLQGSVRATRSSYPIDDGSSKNFDFIPGYVDYERPVFEVDGDDESGPIVTARYPAFHKNPFFRLDQEFRFAIRLTNKDTAKYTVGARLDLTACHASISTSPLGPAWISQAVEAVTRQFYPAINFTRLSLELEE